MSTGTAAGWNFLELGEAARARSALPAIPWPVREGRKEAILREGVALDRLLDEAHDFCVERPARAAALGPAIARLAWLVVVDALESGNDEVAAYYARLGLLYAPRSVSLRAHLAIARWGDRSGSASLNDLVIAVSDASRARFFAPALWLITARALADAGHHREACVLLDDLAAHNPAGASFWDLRAAYRARAVRR